MDRGKGGARIAALLAMLALAAVACGNSNDTGGSDGLSGQVTGDGSSTVFPITEAVAEQFRSENPDVQVTVGVSGTGGGFKKFCNGETDIQDASRAIEDTEKSSCAAKSIDYVELEIAKDGLAVVANPQNTWASCLTTAELKKIWEPKSKVKNWSQVRSGFPATPIKLFGPGTDSGTFDYFTKTVNGEEKASRSDYTPSEDDNVLVQGVEGDKGALGYFGFAYFAANSAKLKLLGVDSGAGCVQPSDATVKDGTYKPLSRPLYLYVRKSSIEKAAVKAFVTYYMQHVSDVLGDVGYTPLDDAALEAARGRWTQAAGE